jgi:aryl-alcohol dehydrogenase-like predicted oxidoreductase
MRYLHLGQDRLSVIGLGCWQFGAKEWDWTEAAVPEAVRVVHRALELGVTLLDTAEIHGRGRSELLLGEALSGRRDKVFLASKVFPTLPIPSRIRAAAQASLARLATERMDLYQLHFPNPLVPLGWQMRGMRDVQAAGWTRHVGVSNYGLARWRDAEAKLGGPVLTNQVEYHLLKRKPEEMLPWMCDQGRVLIAYSPLAQGLLSGRFDGKNPPDDVRRFNPLFWPENLERAAPVLGALREIANSYGATPAQVALAWTIRDERVVAIPGAKTVRQLEENVAAADLRLTEAELRRLDETSAAFTRSRLADALRLPGRLLRRKR